MHLPLFEAYLHGLMPPNAEQDQLPPDRHVQYQTEDTFKIVSQIHPIGLLHYNLSFDFQTQRLINGFCYFHPIHFHQNLCIYIWQELE